MPHDLLQGAALATSMQLDCRRVALAHDGEVFGAGLAGTARHAARRLGVREVVTMPCTGARRAVRHRDRQSVLGSYSIDANGDTTLRDDGVYGIRDTEFGFDRTIVAG